MKRFMERFGEIVSKYADRRALDDTVRSLTYHELEIESGKVYRYLKEKGIGLEDRVMILTERGVASMSCILGILKAGAVFIPLEEGYPEERVDYIKKDADCVLVIDQVLYERILREGEYLAGYEERQLHDASLVIYTSGSTGMPKGILHEWGNIEMQASLIGEKEYWEELQQGLIAPFYFMAAWQFMIHYILRVNTVHILPHDLVRDFRKLTKYLEDKRIEEIFLSPSYLRLYRKPSPYMKEFITAGEPANGLYYPGGKPAIRNLVGMSEGGVTLLETILDKAYDVAPVGKPVLEALDVHLIDEDGNRIEGPGTGEMCFNSPYVRGYINLPEKTKAVFANGICHSGDLHYRDENGVYYILGRKDDMFKINGNRIEPAEIEQWVKEITGLERAHAVGIQENGRAYIAVYYLTAEAEKLGICRDGKLTCDMSALRRHLPDYMIPAFYVGMDEFPLNANGKLNKKVLPRPDAKAFRAEYKKPENEAEQFFCERMQEILGFEPIGAEDDFYSIGGDSIGAIRLIEACEEGGHEISISQLYECRTPRKLAALANEDTNGQMDSMDARSRLEPQPLMYYHRVYLDHYAKDPQQTLYNIPELYELRPEVDEMRLCEAIDKVIRSHPALLTKIIKADGEFRQVYDPDLFEATQIETLGDGEFEHRKASLIEPMKLVGGRLYRSRIFVTPSKKYLFTDFHHIICDGTSLLLLKNQIHDCYEDPGYVIPKDYYYYYASMAGRYTLSDNYREAEAYYGERSRKPGGDHRQCCFLRPDREGPDVGNGLFMKGGFTREGKSDSVKYLSAMCLTVAQMNEEDSCVLFYVYNGRNEARKNHCVGLFARTLPVFYKKRPGETGSEIMADLESQLNFGMAHCEFPVEDLYPEEEANTVLFNYQKNTLDIGRIAGLIAGQIDLPKDSSQKNGHFICGMIDLDGQEQLTYYSAYSKGYYSEEFCAGCCECFEKNSRLF